MKDRVRPIAGSVAAISFVTLLSEIALTKVISYVLFYPFTYLLIGFALLGLGFGAAWVTFKEEWHWTAERSATCLVAFAVGIAVAGLGLSLLPFDLKDPFAGPVDVLVWLVLVVSLVAPFFSSGVLLSTAFRAGAIKPGSLYAADLASAALASVAAIPLLVAIGPVRALLVSALVALAAARALGGSWRRIVGPGGVAVAILTYLAFNHLSAFSPAPGKGMRDLWGMDKVVYSAWHPLFRIDVSFDWKIPEGITRRDLWHDGNVGSGFLGIPDSASASRTWDGTSKQIPFLATSQPSVLVIGAAGGVDLAVAKHYGARRVTGVELHPLTTELIRGPYAEFTGDLVRQPGVEYVNAEGRRYVELTDQEFDLVQLVSPDSYSAQPGASQVLVENYLYTREAFTAYWNALSERGILGLEIGDNLGLPFSQNMLRTVSQARDLLEHVGVEDPERHLLVAVESNALFRVSNVLISRSPFTAETVARVRDGVRGTNVRIVWDPLDPLRLSPPGHLASGGDLAELPKYGLGDLDLRPVTDDRPFFFTYFQWLPLLQGKAAWGLAREYATGQYLLLLLLLIAGGALFLALAIPLFIRDRGVPLSQAWSAGVAVAIIGWAFLAIEVNTIQRLTLYLGYPTYALTAVLSGILLGAGLGSAWSSRVGTVAVLKAGAAAAFLLALTAGTLLPVFLEATFSLSLTLRILVAVGWSLFQGFGLGVFFPTSLRILGEWGPRWVAWGWTVNGTASVFGSALAVLMAMLVGFRYGALFAGFGYLLAAALLIRCSGTESARS